MISHEINLPIQSKCNNGEIDIVSNRITNDWFRYNLYLQKVEIDNLSNPEATPGEAKFKPLSRLSNACALFCHFLELEAGWLHLKTSS